MFSKIIIITLMLNSVIFSQDYADSTKEHSTDTIEVNTKYFNKSVDVSTSYTNAVNEEIRKTVGSAEDVIRYFASSPGVSIANDIHNEIIVRGGSPVENLTIIDGLEIQNPNHYGVPGSTNGLLSFINLKLVKDVDFFSGGFPVKYGDRLSSVMDIKFREGNRSKHIRDFYISLTGFGGFLEGPITKKSSYMLSARRSYYELIKDYLDQPLLPAYWDFNARLNYDLSKSEKISLSGLFAIDKANPNKEGDFMYDTVDVKILSTGFRYSKEGNDFSFRTIAGYNWNFYKVDYQDFILDINDNETSFRQEFDYKINNNLTINLFASVKYYFSKYKVRFSGGINSSGYYSPSVTFNTDVNTLKIAAGFNVTSFYLKNRLILNAGLRIDSYQLIRDKLSVSPRISLSYSITPSTIINVSAGIYYQSPEMLWVLADKNNRNLSYLRTEGFVLGVEQLISNNMKITVESFLKQYHNYPVSVYEPNYIFINSGVEIYPNFLDRAVSVGRGYYTGVDVSFQKKNESDGFFWTIAYSFSKSKFLSMRGSYQKGEFDYGNQLTVISGYKFIFGFSISTRFKFAKGRPYTPFDAQLSFQYDKGIFDMTMFNKANMPDYARLDIRFEQTFRLWKSNFILYAEIWNVLGRRNYFGYYWSSYYNRVESIAQIPRIPILGLSVQF